jgi:hypothetical protein
VPVIYSVGSCSVRIKTVKGLPGISSFINVNNMGMAGGWSSRVLTLSYYLLSAWGTPSRATRRCPEVTGRIR